jgi:homoserine O-succinyltransferase
MPVCVDFPCSGCRGTARTSQRRDKPFATVPKCSSNCVTIGVINNMPDGALEATEHQLVSLLDSVSEGIHIRLSFHGLPNIPRNDLGARHVAEFYSSVENLWDKHLDGLIVTGREPLTSDLREEPYWDSFARVVEWAKENTYSTVWSCLAAHAAVLHMDGIARIKSHDKYFGVFECDRISDHRLTADAPSPIKLPHSRWNGLSKDELTACGYSILTRSSDSDVDTFVKKCKSLFVFFQGHPEYDANSLLLEYRRDVARYLRGERNTYPLIPRDYFDERTAIALTTLQNKAMSPTSDDLFAEVSATLKNSRIENTWQATATSIYRNWLDYICEQKRLRLTGTAPAAQTHAIAGFGRSLAAAELLQISIRDTRQHS